MTSFQGQDWNGFQIFSWVFYVSKYYEFIDTWIIMIKGGKPDALQVIHHAGAVGAMFSLHITAAAVRCAHTSLCYGYVASPVSM